MVSSEGLVRGIDRTLEYAEYTEEERPVSIQIFGGDPEKMAAAAQIVEGMGADIVDVNMGCPVPKIAKHNAGCSLMREPEHAAGVVRAMARAVRIPVTVKMRAGWDATDDQRAGPGAAHGGCRRGRASPCMAEPRRSRTRVLGLGSDRAGRGAAWRFRCSAAATASSRSRSSSGSRNAASGRAGRPRRAAQSVDLRAGRRPRRGPPAARGHARRARPVPARLHRPAAARSACDEAEGFRHVAPGQLPAARAGAARAAASAG